MTQKIHLLETNEKYIKVNLIKNVISIPKAIGVAVWRQVNETPLA